MPKVDTHYSRTVVIDGEFLLHQIRHAAVTFAAPFLPILVGIRAAHNFLVRTRTWLDRLVYSSPSSSGSRKSRSEKWASSQLADAAADRAVIGLLSGGEKLPNRTRLGDPKASEIVAVSCGFLAALAEIARQFYAQPPIAAMIGSAVIIVTVLGLLIFIRAQHESAKAQIQTIIELTATLVEEEHKLVEVQAHTADLRRKLAFAREGQRNVSIYFADLADAKTTFETIMLEAISASSELRIANLQYPDGA